MVTARKSDKIPTLTKVATRREFLVEQIKRYGLWNLNKSKLAVEMKVSRDTLYEDIKAVKDKIVPEEVENIQLNLFLSYRQAVKKLQGIIFDESSPPDRVIRATMALERINSGTVDFLERAGLKDIKPLQIESKSVSLNIQLTDDEFNERLKRYEKAISG